MAPDEEGPDRVRRPEDLEPEPLDISPMVPDYSPNTPVGEIEGMGRFAEGLKRLLSRHRRTD